MCAVRNLPGGRKVMKQLQLHSVYRYTEHVQRINIPRIIRTVSPTRMLPVARFTHQQLHSTRTLGGARGQEVWCYHSRSMVLTRCPCRTGGSQSAARGRPGSAGGGAGRNAHCPGRRCTHACRGREGEREREREGGERGSVVPVAV